MGKGAFGTFRGASGERVLGRDMEFPAGTRKAINAIGSCRRTRPGRGHPAQLSARQEVINLQETSEKGASCAGIAFDHVPFGAYD